VEFESSDLTSGNLFIYKDTVLVILFRLFILLLFLSNTGWANIRSRIPLVSQDCIFKELHQLSRQ